MHRSQITSRIDSKLLWVRASSFLYRPFFIVSEAAQLFSVFLQETQQYQLLCWSGRAGKLMSSLTVSAQPTLQTIMQRGTLPVKGIQIELDEIVRIAKSKNRSVDIFVNFHMDYYILNHNIKQDNMKLNYQHLFEKEIIGLEIQVNERLNAEMSK